MPEQATASKTAGAVPALSAAAARQMDVIAVVEPFLADIDVSDPMAPTSKALLEKFTQARESPG
ncbi:MAG TPA: hypothetical protein VFR90_09870 [Methylibium sp.]|uniref:hypothetical protein n=1 Tax=Methylibium sp. TaxID=2067992 RepID=UPI002DBA0A3E|nr:hypothetical protein [Methylibium sp.]HEU4459417.1 hypothetical protein [Methylibium sp.]